TSTLSLAIVAATVSLQMGMISEGMNSAIVLVSILTCFISPIIYARISPKVEEKKERLAIVGANRAALRASINFQKSNYEVTIFSVKQAKIDIENNNHEFPIVELENITLDSMIDQEIFQVFDRVIVATSNDQLNIEIAEYARKIDFDKLIVRIED